MLFFLGGLILAGAIFGILRQRRMAAQPIPVRIEDEEYYRR